MIHPNQITILLPDVKSLIKNCAGIPNLVFPGILDGAINMLDKSKQYVLSIDGKKIAAGLGKPLFGDINLWGHEKPNLEEALGKEIKIYNL